MNPIFIAAIVILAGAVALYLIVTRRTTRPPQSGRPDSLERPELTGTEQHKHRDQP